MVPGTSQKRSGNWKKATVSLRYEKSSDRKSGYQLLPSQSASASRLKPSKRMRSCGNCKLKRLVVSRDCINAKPPLKQVDEEYSQLLGDRGKFIDFINIQRGKAEKMRLGISAMKSAILEHCEWNPIKERTDAEAQSIAIAENDLREIESAVAAQNISADEVSRMNHERESLSRNLEELRGKLQQARKHCHHQEMEVTDTMDRLSDLQQNYASIGHQIGCLGPSCKARFLPSEGGVDCSLEVELGSGDLTEMSLVGRTWNQVIRPALQEYGDDFHKEARTLQDDSIALEDLQDRLAQEVEQQRADAATREVRLKLIHDQTEEAKHVSSDAA